MIFTVDWAFAIDGVGFTAARKITGIPFVIPPLIPPLLFDFVYILSFSIQKVSFAVLPVISEKPNPTPNSIPFIAGILKIIWEISLSTLSKNGSPIPAGSPVIAVSILFVVDVLKYKTGKKIEQILAEQWIVARWFVLLCLIGFVILFGCYGPGFDSAQFIYFQF